MAVTSVHTFRTRPGRVAEHVSLTLEACALLQGKGLRVAAFQPIAGGEAGTILVTGAYDDFRDYAATEVRLNADSDWQAFMARAIEADAAEPAGIALLADVDPSYVVPTDVALGALSAYIWRPRAGKGAAFLGDVTTGVGHINRLGARTRVLQSVIGGLPGSIAVTIGFEDLAHFGEFNDKLAVDEQWQAFWVGLMGDPSGELLDSGLYVPIGQ